MHRGCRQGGQNSPEGPAVQLNPGAAEGLYAGPVPAACDGPLVQCIDLHV